MDYYNKFVTKRERWQQWVILFAIIIIGIFALIYLVDVEKTDVEDDNKQSTNWWKWICLGLLIIIVYLVFGRGKKEFSIKTSNEIIEFIANEIYNDKKVYMRTALKNVRVQKGGVNETYVQFINEYLTCLYLEGSGIIEIYPGESIKQVKEGKHSDVIEMKVAEIGLAQKKHLVNLEGLDLTDELK